MWNGICDRGSANFTIWVFAIWMHSICHKIGTGYTVFLYFIDSTRDIISLEVAKIQVFATFRALFAFFWVYLCVYLFFSICHKTLKFAIWQCWLALWQLRKNFWKGSFYILLRKPMLKGVIAFFGNTKWLCWIKPLRSSLTN